MIDEDDFIDDAMSSIARRIAAKETEIAMFKELANDLWRAFREDAHLPYPSDDDDDAHKPAKVTRAISPPAPKKIGRPRKTTSPNHPPITDKPIQDKPMVTGKVWAPEKRPPDFAYRKIVIDFLVEQGTATVQGVLAHLKQVHPDHPGDHSIYQYLGKKHLFERVAPATYRYIGNNAANGVTPETVESPDVDNGEADAEQSPIEIEHSQVRVIPVAANPSADFETEARRMAVNFLRTKASLQDAKSILSHLAVRGLPIKDVGKLLDGVQNVTKVGQGYYKYDE